MASYRSAAGRNVVTTKRMMGGSLVRFFRPRALPRIDHGDRGEDEANDTLGMDPFGIQVRVVDRDVPPRWVRAHRRGDDERELLPSEAAGLRVVDRRKRPRRQDVEVEVEPPRVGEKPNRLGGRDVGFGGEAVSVHDREAIAERGDALGTQESGVARTE